MTQVVWAEDADVVAVPDVEAEGKSAEVEAGPENEEELEEEAREGAEETKNGGKPRFTLASGAPAHGPVSGDTKVLVRADRFQRYSSAYSEPKCRFGSDSAIVGAAYVGCTPNAQKATDREAKRSERTATCVQCEGSPPSVDSRPVELTVSLTGDFTDSSNSLNFYYYKSTHVTATKPTHGPKDGGTNVQVWGSNFQDFGDDTTCSFGTKAVKATVHSAGYITCTAPPSDVVQRSMPFGISLNGQQQSKEDIGYWYYNNP
jgi:hypothetical protein